jgi:hypothetical protein
MIILFIRRQIMSNGSPLIAGADYQFLADNISDAYTAQLTSSDVIETGLDHVLKLDQKDQEYDLLPPYYTTDQNLDSILGQTTNYEQVTLALQNHVVNRGQTTVPEYYTTNGITVTEEFAAISKAVGYDVDAFIA